MLTYGTQLTSRITSVMQKQRLDEMPSGFCTTQMGRIQFEWVTERDSSSDCKETERTGSTLQALLPLPLSPSLSMGVLMLFVVASCLLCGAGRLASAAWLSAEAILL